MNKPEIDILLALDRNSYRNQRQLAEESGHSLGVINQSLRYLLENGYIDDSYCLTQKASGVIEKNTPRNAIILAAGYGMRMVPINMETPKGLIEIRGERLVERIVKQLHDVGIYEIYVVVGFMKELYEYLIDEYEVKIIVNMEYVTKNNLHSLIKAKQYIGNTYIVPCDVWCASNPFNRREGYSWYMVNDSLNEESQIYLNRKQEIVINDKRKPGNTMIGISYIAQDVAGELCEKIAAMGADKRYDQSFWEEALFCRGKMIIHSKIVSKDEAIEINTYEQLRELDSNSNQLQSGAIETIAQTLGVNTNAIKHIEILKKGMTNRSFLFKCKGQRYIMRIPGEGTGNLINRENEANIYRTICGLDICDEVVYINAENGYKITKYIENSRVCDPNNREDLIKCMNKLRSFHDMDLVVDTEFKIYEQIAHYEELWNGNKSSYKDYENTYNNVLSLRKYIEAHIEKRVLTHIDAVPDNFLFFQDEDGQEKVYLIDWEYAGIQDPHVDIAMFCIYALFSKEQIDEVIDIYFQGKCNKETRIKIYCYIAACGLLWSNWCEYKRMLGVDFGEYSIRQYRYAKEYYAIVCRELGEVKRKWDIK